MFIHLGGNTVIRAKEVIAIFNVEVETTSPTTVAFLNQAKANDNLEVIAEEETKSIVVTREKVYYSPIASVTLKRRSFDDITFWNETNPSEV